LTHLSLGPNPAGVSDLWIETGCISEIVV